MAPIEITSIHMSESPALHRHVSDRLSRALRTVKDRVTRIIVSFRDDNGPRGGVDKRCAVEVRLAGIDPIRVEERDADLFQASARAALRVRRAVRRTVERRRDR